jgi:hypothetical protein
MAFAVRRIQRPIVDLEKLRDQLDMSDRRLHCLCPAGVGDFCWILSKWWSIAEGRPVTFWFPDREQHRADQYARLVGAEHGFLPELTTQWVWGEPDDPGQPKIPRAAAILRVQANRHLEHGRRIEEWYPRLPYRTPEPKISVRDTWGGKFFLAFTCHEGYMDGNLEPEVWARMALRISANIAPVRFVGAHLDVPFIERILALAPSLLPREAHILDQDLEAVLAAAQRAEGFIGVAGGPIIAAIYMGAPAIVGYPEWLDPMPGSWEPPETRQITCRVQELPETVDAVIDEMEWPRLFKP